MADKITRLVTAPIDVAVTSSTSTSGTFVLSDKAGGVLHVVAASGTLTLKFYSLPDGTAGTAFLLADAFNADVAVTIAQGSCYQLPDELFACARIRPVVTSGTATLRLLLKS